MSRTNLSTAFTPAERADARPQRVANNTFERVMPNGDRVIRLHTTDIVALHVDGSMTLNSGGWRTIVTKARLNDYACQVGFQLQADRGEWHVVRGGERAPYFDGMRLPRDFRPGAPDDPERKKLAAQIARFCALVDTVETLPVPDSGDCWFCAMLDRETERGPRNGSWAGAPKNPTSPAERNPDHLCEHMREGYLPGALLVNAARWAGYSDNNVGHWYVGDYRDMFRRALRRYLRFRFGFSA